MLHKKNAVLDPKKDVCDYMYETGKEKAKKYECFYCKTKNVQF